MQNPLLQPSASSFAVAFWANSANGVCPATGGKTVWVEVQKNLLVIYPTQQGSDLLHLPSCVDMINRPSADPVGAFCYIGPPSSDAAMACDTKMYHRATIAHSQLLNSTLPLDNMPLLYRFYIHNIFSNSQIYIYYKQKFNLSIFIKQVNYKYDFVNFFYTPPRPDQVNYILYKPYSSL